MKWVRQLLCDVGLVDRRKRLAHFDERIRSAELTSIRQERAIVSLERRAELVARRLGKLDDPESA